MRRKCCWPAVVLMTLFPGLALADDVPQEPPQDPLQSLLFSPELLMQHRQEIGLSDEQVQQIHTCLEETAPAAQEQEMRLKEAVDRLAKLLSADNVDEEAALQQFTKVLESEQDLKRLHLRLMIRIRNQLTPKQRETAAMIRQKAPSAEDLQRRLQAKVSRIEKEVQTRADAGQPPTEIVELMQKFPELMEKGQIKEAEALLDRVIGRLGLDKK